MFKLLYSTGMRTIEARLLKKENVDLKNGIISIENSKGYNQHYIALHESMKKVLIIMKVKYLKYILIEYISFQIKKIVIIEKIG